MKGLQRHLNSDYKGVNSALDSYKNQPRVKSRLDPTTIIKLRLAALMVSLIVVIYTLFLNQVFIIFLGASFWARILVSLFLLMPLGFFLGMPFPLGMKLLSEFGLENYVPRMWAVNGIGSVLGSALSIALSISFGFSYAMTLGALLYFSIFILFPARLLGTRRPKVSRYPESPVDDLVKSHEFN